MRKHREVLRPHPCAARREPVGEPGRDRGPAGRQRRGQVHADQVLSGAVPYSSARIFIKAARLQLNSTNDAISNGLETIYQDSALVPQLSIARNLFLGRETAQGAALDGPDGPAGDEPRGLRPAARGWGSRRTSRPRPRSAAVGRRSGQAVAIARAMYSTANIIILDEPTTNLGWRRRRRAELRPRRADKGHACIFIAHNIHHVFQVVRPGWWWIAHGHPGRR